jgi:hypothetical protein
MSTYAFSISCMHMAMAIHAYSLDNHSKNSVEELMIKALLQLRNINPRGVEIDNSPVAHAASNSVQSVYIHICIRTQ